MSKNKLVLLPVFLLAIAFAANAQSPKNISFPIAELGNCSSQTDCKGYCDKSENILACVEFGEKNDLITAEEASQAREFADVLKGGGPGGCTGKESCENYCNDINNMDECLSFAEEHKLMSADELKEAKSVQKALREGAKLPGGCKNKEECEKYCGNENNILECVAFAEKAGFIGKEEAEMVRKTGGKGPGGCVGKEACETYCENPANQSTCFEFAKQYGLIPEEKLAEMKEGLVRLKESLEMAPPEIAECLKQNLGENIIEDIESGKLMPGPDIGDKVKTCFESMMKEGMQFRGGPEGVGGTFEDMLNRVPVEVRGCIREHVGDNTDEDWASERNQSRVREFVTDCMKKLNISKPVSEDGIQAVPPAGFEPTPEMMGEICQKFSLAPSCDYVPAEFRDLCLQCKQ